MNFTYLFVAALCVFFVSVLIVVTSDWHGALTMDQQSGVQKVHTNPTPRIGGLPIFIGLAFLVGLMQQGSARELLFMLLLAGVPAVLAGLAEDVTKKVGVTLRLLATMLSGVAAWWLTGYSLMRLDLPVIDEILHLVVPSVLFTAFAVGGVANAINIIDGFNGLASITSLTAFVGLGLIAVAVGDFAVAQVTFALATCVLGFLVVNWPLGKLFLGDGGAYFLGFAIAWIAVLLVQRNPSVSAFSALVICSHPINEVLFTIYRRTVKRVHPGMPDRLHLHSLMNRRYVRRLLVSAPAWKQNSATGLLVSTLTVFSVIVAMHTYSSTRLSVFTYLSLSAVHLLIYKRLIRLRFM